MILLVLVVLFSLFTFAELEFTDDMFNVDSDNLEQVNDYVKDTYGSNINLDAKVDGLQLSNNGELSYAGDKINLNDLQKYAGKDVNVVSSEMGIDVYVNGIKVEDDGTGEVDYEITDDGVEFDKVNLKFENMQGVELKSTETGVVIKGAPEIDIKDSKIYLGDGGQVAVVSDGFVITNGKLSFNDANGETVSLTTKRDGDIFFGYDGAIKGDVAEVVIGDVVVTDAKYGYDDGMSSVDYKGEVNIPQRKFFLGNRDNIIPLYKPEFGIPGDVVIQGEGVSLRAESFPSATANQVVGVAADFATKFVVNNINQNLVLEAGKYYFEITQKEMSKLYLEGLNVQLSGNEQSGVRFLGDIKEEKAHVFYSFVDNEKTISVELRNDFRNSQNEVVASSVWYNRDGNPKASVELKQDITNPENAYFGGSYKITW